MANSSSTLSKEAKQLWSEKQWGAYRNLRYEMAEERRWENREEQAMFLYVEVMIFDLQGVASGVGEHGFSRAYRGETPSVAREIARFSLREHADQNQLREIYEKVAAEFWVDAFPRSQTEVWDELKDIVQDYRETLRLKEKVASLGSDQLLPSSEMEAYVEVADDYELLQRVGTLLEPESPRTVPWAKRKRAHDYLSDIDIHRIGDRWKAKAYRWAGTVVLSNGEKEAALDYFERALAVVDRDDQVVVERMAKTLRQELGR